MGAFLFIFFAPIICFVIYYFLIKKHPSKTVKKNVGVLKDEGIMVVLAKKNKISHDTFEFEFGFGEDDSLLGIEVGQHILLHAKIKTLENPDGEEIFRKYTPISKVDERGKFILLIKVYRRNVHPKFPEGGKMTQYLESLNIGDKIKVSGPKGKLIYRGLGKTQIKYDDGVRIKTYKKIGMIAGGTGIAPMYQLIKCIIDNNDDNTLLSLLFANKTEDDILMKPELDTISENYSKLRLFYTLDTPAPTWKNFSGFINMEMLEKSMPPPSDDTLIAICGPPMMNKLVKDLLKQIGYNEIHIFSF